VIVNLLVLTFPLDEQAEVSIKSTLEARIAASSHSGALIAEDLGKNKNYQNCTNSNQAT